MKFINHSIVDSIHFHLPLNNNRGSALVVALLMLVVLTLIGISATTTTTFELQIAGNDKLYKRAFYAADGATEMGGELIEQNIEDRNWDYGEDGVTVLKIPLGWRGDFFVRSRGGTYHREHQRYKKETIGNLCDLCDLCVLCVLCGEILCLNGALRHALLPYSYAKRYFEFPGFRAVCPDGQGVLELQPSSRQAI